MRTKLAEGAGAVAVLLMLTAACGVGGSAPRAVAKSQSPSPVLTDTAAVTESFPGLGAISAARWTEDALGVDTRGSVPGPTDFRFEAVVVLTDENARNLRERYTWTLKAAPAPGPRLATGLDPAQTSRRWSTNSEFSGEVLGGSADVYIDFPTRTAYFTTLR
ncbi:hypothetical protein EDD29_4993 [Actinocorallia herbida]|uniref:Uncharacterized protein n=1 Tax=Actinocorallia herbida TaxID=58109 RepID=A0A3N1D2T6_9ACTN|nr:hypothetical protein [Actinocorallia herbida]ROO87388.1 hypothetical protein EDD29_4993 [Actinocorallia herbida]